MNDPDIDDLVKDESTIYHHIISQMQPDHWCSHRRLLARIDCDPEALIGAVNDLIDADHLDVALYPRLR